MITCPYCGKPAKLVSGTVVYPHRKDLRHLRFWQCVPCNAYVGTHIGTKKPYGTLANDVLRGMRRRVHLAFDPMWSSGDMSRSQAYKQLSTRMGLKSKACHIGKFNVQECIEALEVLM